MERYLWHDFQEVMKEIEAIFASCANPEAQEHILSLMESELYEIKLSDRVYGSDY